MRVLRQVKVDLAVQMTSDFHVGSGAGIAGLADRAVIRLANNELVIPGSAIKGRVRHHCEQLARTLKLRICGGKASDSALCKDDLPPCLICSLFGSEWRPGTLRFSDAKLSEWLRNLVQAQQDASDEFAEFDYQVTSRTRNRRNRVLGRAEESALFTFEQGTGGLVFEGVISGPLLCSETGGEALPLEIAALLASIRLVQCLGGKKTIGLGACVLKVNGLTVEESIDISLLPELLAKNLDELALYDEYQQIR